jgi:hypothetical protein
MVRSPTGSSGVVVVVVGADVVVVVSVGVVVVVSTVGDGAVVSVVAVLSVEAEVQAVSVRTRKVVRTHIATNIDAAGTPAFSAVLPLAGGRFLRPTKEGGGRRERSLVLGVQVPLVGPLHPPRLLRRRYTHRERRESSRVAVVACAQPSSACGRKEGEVPSCWELERRWEDR